MNERLLAFTPEADQAVGRRPRARSGRTSRRRQSRSSTCSWPARRRRSICSTTSRCCSKHDGQEIPKGFIPEGERFAFVKGTPRLLGSPFDVHAARPVGRRDLGAAAPPAEARGRDRHHPLDEDDAVQPRAGADLHEHRAPDHRPAQHRLVAQLRPGQRQQGPAGVRRAISGQNNPDGGKSCWGSGFLPTVHQGVEFRSKGEPVLFSHNPDGVDATARRESLDLVRDLEHDRAPARRAIPRRRRGSRRTSWRTGCRRACPS